MDKFIKNDKKLWHITSFVSVLAAALLQSFVISTFIEPSNFLSGGFTGIALLVQRIGGLFGKNIPVSITLVALNLPVALICSRAISKRFVFYSLLEVILSSLFLNFLNFTPIFNSDDDILNAIFGGFIFGISSVIALKGRASSGGTDFIALYVSNKKNKAIWNYIFIFNLILLSIFGFLFEWSYAGYSIIFQFVSTKTISAFHRRYERVTLQITTSNPKEVVEEYIKNFKHGLSCIDGIGGYSKKHVTLIHTVVSSYEVADIVSLLKNVDPYIIINMFKTDQFYGKFNQKPLE